MSRPPIFWTADMLAALNHLRRSGHCYKACADRIGIDERVVARKCRELRLNQRMNFGRISGRERAA